MPYKGLCLFRGSTVLLSSYLTNDSIESESSRNYVDWLSELHLFFKAVNSGPQSFSLVTDSSNLMETGLPMTGFRYIKRYKYAACI